MEFEMSQGSGGDQELAQGVCVDVRTHAVQQLQLLNKEHTVEKSHNLKLTCSIGKLFWERSKTGRKEVMAENLGKTLKPRVKTIKCCVSLLFL